MLARFGVGGVIALGHADDRAAHRGELLAGKILVEELRDRQIVLQRREFFRQQLETRRVVVAVGHLAAAHVEAFAVAPAAHQRQARFGDQRLGDGRFAMDELGAAFGAIAEFARRQFPDAAADAVARFEDGDAMAGAREFAPGHQARGARRR